MDFTMRHHYPMVAAMIILGVLTCLTLQGMLPQSNSRINDILTTQILAGPPYLPNEPTINHSVHIPTILGPRQLAEQPHGCRLNEGSRCINMDDLSIKRCPDGETFAGWLSGCDPLNLNYGDPLCCPVTRSPKSCIWRGQEADGHTCNGQCHEGETVRGLERLGRTHLTSAQVRFLYSNRHLEGATTAPCL